MTLSLPSFGSSADKPENLKSSILIISCFMQ